MSPGASSSPTKDAAVIDVGSNSVRLVLYRLEGRAIWPTYNEKVLAGLGRDLGTTKKLSPEGSEQALSALRRFRAVLDATRPQEAFAVGTAALRDAEDGPGFIRRVHDEVGLNIRVLSGEEEARYSALGVVAGAPDGEGVVGDLGGASLELTRLAGRESGDAATLGLGPFGVAFRLGDDPRKLRKQVEAQIAEVADRFQAETFHAVGGAWRNLALLHMGIADYPLRVVHEYEMTRTEALTAARVISHLSASSLTGIPGISAKRAETLPYAAVVLEALVGQLGLRRVLTSAYGLREGLLYEAMEPQIRAVDPLVAGCQALGGRFATDEGLGPALERWLEPVFATLPSAFGGRDKVLIAAACRLADLGATLHPDHRATLIFEQVLRAPIAGQTHAERCFLAVAAFHRHTAHDDLPEASTIARIIPDFLRRRARALGAAIRLGCDLSGRSSGLLSRSHIALEDGKLVLSTQPKWADMLLGEQTKRRAQALANALNVGLEIRLSPSP
jgi:exopolyphosphatase/guanosine-5'-triphosphate,3'-diphosphate pyrophosphatase